MKLNFTHSCNRNALLRTHIQYQGNTYEVLIKLNKSLPLRPLPAASFNLSTFNALQHETHLNNI
jgi:hypothetical protein